MHRRRILISAVGRRGYLVDYFRAALGPTGRVFAADADLLAPGLSRADGRCVLPHAADPAYIDELLACCKRHQVGAVLSVDDRELPVLARARERLLSSGVTPIVSPSAVVDMCIDKWSTFKCLRDAGFDVPTSHLGVDSVLGQVDGRNEGPVWLSKPRWGSGSQGVQVVSSRDDILAAVAAAAATVVDRKLPPEVVVQEMLVGDEYGLDVVNDLRGNYLGTLVRKKLRSRHGETSVAVTADSPQLQHLGRRLSQTLRHFGPLDCDVIVTERGAFVLDLNPRFGGGYPLSHVAGANVPAIIVANLTNELWDPQWLRPQPGVVAAKSLAIDVVAVS